MAVPRLDRILAAAAAIALLAGCSTPPRSTMTLDQQLVAQPPGFDDIRFFTDTPRSELPPYRRAFRPAGRGGRPTYLALSGGGEHGAYGAGFLVGWSQSGTRPEFDLVTGISAGALIAPFAFVGSDKDAQLRTLFDGGTAAQLNGSKNFLAGLFGEGVLNARPLRDLIDTNVDADLLGRIAARHRDGARLLVVTTNIDAERSMVWDMGAIAASGHPDAARLFGDVLEASASIPGAFPPVTISVEADGGAFDELHVDGGAIRQIFFFPEAFLRSPDWSGMRGTRPRIYGIMNNELLPVFDPIKDKALSVVEQSYGTRVRESGVQSMDQARSFADDHGIDFRLTFIDQHFPSNPKLVFDPDYMRAAFQLGLAKGRAQSWDRAVPIGTDLLQVARE